MSASATKFWVICCEETEAIKEIARTVDGWNLAGVRSLSGDRQALLSQVDAIADASYVIFVTPDDRPCSQVKVQPLNIAQSTDGAAAAVGEQSPVKMMVDALNRHGRSPQSWLLQLPTAEIRAQYEQPVPVRKSVAQAVAAIEVFVRNYTQAAPFSIPAKTKKPKREVVLSHYRRV